MKQQIEFDFQTVWEKHFHISRVWNKFFLAVRNLTSISSICECLEQDQRSHYQREMLVRIKLKVNMIYHYCYSLSIAILPIYWKTYRQNSSYQKMINLFLWHLNHNLLCNDHNCNVQFGIKIEIEKSRLRLSLPQCTLDKFRIFCIFFTFCVYDIITADYALTWEIICLKSFVRRKWTI